jgi:hypothetical protein
MSDAEAPDDLATFVRENRELITRLLAHGNAEARGYALAALANSGTVEDVEAIQAKLEALKEDRE